MIIDVHHHYSDGTYYTDYPDFPAQLVAAMGRYGWDWVNVPGEHPEAGCPVRVMGIWV